MGWKVTAVFCLLCNTSTRGGIFRYLVRNVHHIEIMCKVHESLNLAQGEGRSMGSKGHIIFCALSITLQPLEGFSNYFGSGDMFLHRKQLSSLHFMLSGCTCKMVIFLTAFMQYSCLYIYCHCKELAKWIFLETFVLYLHSSGIIYSHIFRTCWCCACQLDGCHMYFGASSP